MTKAENTPHYKVLFSGPGPSSVTIGYLPQTQLQRVTGIRVGSQNRVSANRTTRASKHLPLLCPLQPDIPTLENYFTHFDGERFIMQPWLQKIYPEDSVEDNSFWDTEEHDY